MARSFNLTANLVLAGPANLRPIVQQIKSGLSGISATVDVKINPAVAGNINTLNKAFGQFNNTLKITSQNARDAASAINALGSAIKSVNLNSLNQQLKSTVTNVNGAAKAAKSLRGEWEEFGHVAGLAVRRFAGFAVATNAIMGTIGALKTGITEAIKFQDAMVKISQLTGGTVSGAFSQFGSQIQDLSTTLGVSSAKLVDITHKLVQAGLQAGEMKDVMNALAKSMLAPAFDNVDQTMEGTIALMKQFTIPARDVEKALSSMHAMAGAFAVESQDLITAVRIAGGAFGTMSKGVVEGRDALNQFMATFTSIRAVTRESAESIATGLRTIFTRLQRPEAIMSLKQLGIELTDLEGKFVGPYEAINRITTAMSKMDSRDPRFAQVAEQLGGYRQIGKVLPLLQNAELRTKALGVAQAGSAQLTDAAARAQESWAVQLTKVHEKFLALIRDISQTDGFKALMNVILGVANSLLKLGDAIKPILPYLGILMGMKVASAVGPWMTGFFGGAKGKMASGGMVPGSGNGDTFPAMLTPGEFVIRKDAVRAIGADKLAQVNKMKTGGRVLSLTKVGAKQKENWAKAGLDVQDLGEKGEILDRVYDGLLIEFSNHMADVSKNAVRFNGPLRNVSPAFSNTNAMKGYMFETMLAKFGTGVTGQGSSKIDLSSGMSPYLAEFFGLSEDFGSKQVELKHNLGNQDINETRGKFGLPPLKKKKKKPVIKLSNQEIINSFYPSLSDEDKARFNTYQKFDQAKIAKGIKTKWATGGSVDSVPAMLTPGEFVINKNAASRLGLGVLNKLNNADKVQHFAGGGQVNSNRHAYGTFKPNVDEGYLDTRASIKTAGGTSGLKLVLSGKEQTKVGELVNQLAKLGNQAGMSSAYVMKLVNAVDEADNPLKAAAAGLKTMTKFAREQTAYASYKPSPVNPNASIGERVRDNLTARNNDKYGTRSWTGLTLNKAYRNDMADIAKQGTSESQINKAYKIYEKKILLGVSTFDAHTAALESLTKTTKEQSALRRKEMVRNLPGQIKDVALSSMSAIQSGAKAIPGLALRGLDYGTDAIANRVFGGQTVKRGIIASGKGIGRAASWFNNTILGDLGEDPDRDQAGNIIPGTGRKGTGLRGKIGKLSGKLGTAGMFAGTALQQIFGENNPAAAGIGGAMSGASAGAMIAGPYGALAGGIIGGAEGFFGAKANTAKKEADIKIENSTKALSEAFDKLAKGGSLAEFDKALSNANKAIGEKLGADNLGNRTSSGNFFGLFGSGGSEQDYINSQKGLTGRGVDVVRQSAANWQNFVTGGNSIQISNAKLQAEETQAFRNSRAQSFAESQSRTGSIAAEQINRMMDKGISLDEIMKNKGLVSTAAGSIVGSRANEFAGRELQVRDLESRGVGAEARAALEKDKADAIRATLGPQEEMRKKTEALNKVIDEANFKFEIFTSNMEVASAKLSLVSNVGSAKMAENEALMGSPGKLMASTNVNMFSNPLAYSSSQLGNQAQRMLSNLGLSGNAQMQQAASYMTTGNNLRANMGNLLSATEEDYNKKGGDIPAITVLQNKLRPMLDKAPKELSDKVSASLEKVAKDDNLSANQKMMEVRKILDSTTKEISDAGAKPLAEIQDKLFGIQERYKNMLEQQLNLQMQINDKVVDINGMYADQDNAFKKLMNPDRELTFAEKTSPLTSRVQSYGVMGGLNAAQATDPNAIGNRLQSLLLRNNSINQQINNTNPADTATIVALRELEKTNQQQIAALTKGLDLLHNDNVSMQALEEEMAKIQRKSEAAKNTVFEVAGMSRQDRFKYNRNQKALGNFLDGGQVNDRNIGNIMSGFKGVEGILTAANPELAKKISTEIALKYVRATGGQGTAIEKMLMQEGKNDVAKRAEELQNRQAEAAEQSLNVQRAILVAVSGGDKNAAAQYVKDAESAIRSSTKKAGGGIIGGTFRGGDTVPAMLTPGEFVIRRDVAQQNLGLLQAINSGEIMGFASGGRVPGHINRIKEKIAFNELVNLDESFAEMAGVAGYDNMQVNQFENRQLSNYNAFESRRKANRDKYNAKRWRSPVSDTKTYRKFDAKAYADIKFKEHFNPDGTVRDKYWNTYMNGRARTDARLDREEILRNETKEQKLARARKETGDYRNGYSQPQYGPKTYYGVGAEPKYQVTPQSESNRQAWSDYRKGKISSADYDRLVMRNKFGIRGYAGGGVVQNTGGGGINGLEQLTNAISKIPSSIAIQGNIRTTIDLNGAGALAQALVNELMPAINNAIQSQITSVINPNTGETSPISPGGLLGGGNY